uniref:Uncharacterized protein n=1 Tax=Anguilla anguilla TaxID=7936 RepID=A0A0E9R2R7_ANGAN
MGQSVLVHFGRVISLNGANLKLGSCPDMILV